MEIKKLNINEFSERVLSISMMDTDWENGLTSDYLSAFVNKKLEISYCIPSDLHESDIQNTYGSKANFKEFILFLEKNPTKIKEVLLKRRILGKISRIENRISHSMRMAKIKGQGELASFGNFKVETRQRDCQPIMDIFYRGEKISVSSLFPHFPHFPHPLGYEEMEEKLNEIVVESEKIYDNLKGKD